MDAEYEEARKLERQLITSQNTEYMKGFSFWPVPEIREGNNIYDVRSYQLIPGNIETISVDRRLKLGRKFLYFIVLIRFLLHYLLFRKHVRLEQLLGKRNPVPSKCQTRYSIWRLFLTAWPASYNLSYLVSNVNFQWDQSSQYFY